MQSYMHTTYLELFMKSDIVKEWAARCEAHRLFADSLGGLMILTTQSWGLLDHSWFISWPQWDR